MKICNKTHTTTAFGEIPKGSLWEDDSEYIESPGSFDDVPAAKAKAAE